MHMNFSFCLELIDPNEMKAWKREKEGDDFAKVP